VHAHSSLSTRSYVSSHQSAKVSSLSLGAAAATPNFVGRRNAVRGITLIAEVRLPSLSICIDPGSSWRSDSLGDS
jgi:hypothetical protein